LVTRGPSLVTRGPSMVTRGPSVVTRIHPWSLLVTRGPLVCTFHWYFQNRSSGSAFYPHPIVTICYLAWFDRKKKHYNTAILHYNTVFEYKQDNKISTHLVIRDAILVLLVKYLLTLSEVPERKADWRLIKKTKADSFIFKMQLRHTHIISSIVVFTD
jgi:hypothetical protein